MEKQNGHVSREQGGGQGAADSMVRAPEGQGGGEQTRTDSMGGRAAQEGVCTLQWALWGQCWARRSLLRALA